MRSVTPYYHAADLFALASVARSEAFGIVQIEAMAAGLPVVNTSLDSGVPFVSLDGQTGLTVPPGDPEALAAALNRLLDDDGLRQSLGQAGVRRARQEFSLDTMLRRTLAALSDRAAPIQEHAFRKEILMHIRRPSSEKIEQMRSSALVSRE